MTLFNDILLIPIETRVMIKDLHLFGIIKSIWITSQGVQYQVRYFWNSEAKETYFYKNEVEERPL